MENDRIKKINKFLRFKFERKCGIMVELLRGEINDHKHDGYMTKLFACLMGSAPDDETMVIVIIPEGLPENKKNEFLDGIGNELQGAIKKYNTDNSKDYVLYSLFLVSEVWIAKYNHPPHSVKNYVPPAERKDRKEYLMIMGESILRDKFMCQIELKRYSDHILAGNEIDRMLLWNDENDKESNEGKLRTPTLDRIFMGYAKSNLAASSLS